MNEGRLVRALRRAGSLRARLQQRVERGLVSIAFSIPSLDRRAIVESLRRSFERPLPSESMAEW